MFNRVPSDVPAYQRRWAINFLARCRVGSKIRLSRVLESLTIFAQLNSVMILPDLVSRSARRSWYTRSASGGTVSELTQSVAASSPGGASPVILPIQDPEFGVREVRPV